MTSVIRVRPIGGRVESSPLWCALAMSRGRQDEHISISVDGPSPKGDVKICSWSQACDICIITTLVNAADQLVICVVIHNIAISQGAFRSSD